MQEEDNEELYCRTCDQWFHNLHNKREHLQGRQHIQSVAGAIKQELAQDADNCARTASTTSFSASLDESSLDTPGNLKKKFGCSSLDNVSDAMKHLFGAVFSMFIYYS